MRRYAATLVHLIIVAVLAAVCIAAWLLVFYALGALAG